MAVKLNFFIVGAPKCGTTALYEYPRIETPQACAEIFAESTGEHLRVGEASVHYLRSSVALANIREFTSDARIIAMFRNPVEMVYSLHSQLLYVSEETVSDFATAWRLEERRSRGIDLPPAIRSSLLVQCAQIGQFGTQARRVLSLFPPA